MLYEEAAGSGVMSFQSGTFTTDTLLTFLLGLGIVFVGLVSLVVIVKIMGLIMEKVSSRKAPVEDHAVHAQPVPETHAEQVNHGEMIAAVSAALATVMGRNVSGIRIHSMKKL